MADISIITATFNSEPTVGDCLASVQNQQGVSVEHIVIDGGSTDRTVDIVRRSGQVARLISEPDDGIYDAMNKGIGLATGDIIGIFAGSQASAWDLVSWKLCFPQCKVRAGRGSWSFRYKVPNLELGVFAYFGIRGRG